ncbi:Bcr/CflA family drug resistance efflux transporter [Kaistia sp. 32K]|uniref:multidrug effflux MFS transporter n=1 Tax=Kaistia sp. 32K TaxID=2795690 RepID=UPI00191576A2|nr:multidrug effflux MFS transporter [Kaistia sp. 32K]BCP54401.1 Bcr/CflA family drug resistance efflux transporter [Kaistia sp. 32K]
MSSSILRYAVILGLLSAIGPFAIDMYLPALPAIGQDLGATTGAVQMSLMAFFISVGLGQLIYGPVADMVGRKPPLYFGLALFALGSIGCALAPTVEILIAFRFVQGLGACAGMVVPRAVVRDLHTGNDAARLMSLLMLVFSISPILAPLAGSAVTAIASWRAIFWIVMVAAILGIALLALALDETRPAEQRVESGVGSALAGYWLLLRDRHFLGLVFIGAFGISSFFAYLANSSFVLIEHYGLTPTQYSLAFSINAVSFFGFSQLNGRLGGMFGLKRVMRVAVTGFAISVVVLFLLMASGIDGLAVLIGVLFVANGFLGLVIPTSAVLALDEHGEIAGTASALMGTLQMVTGAVVMAVVGLFLDGTALPMVAGIAACGVIAFTLAQVTLGRRGRAVTAPAE